MSELTWQRERIGQDDGSIPSGILDVLDPKFNGRFRMNDPIHRQMVDNFGAIKRQFCCLRWCDGRQEPRCGDLGRVCCEYPINLFPYLQFIRRESDGYEGSTEVRIASTDFTIHQTAWNSPKVPRHDWYPIFTSQHSFLERSNQFSVERWIQAFRALEMHDVGEIYIFRVDPLRLLVLQ
jgi:hypothetical protein